MSKQIQRSPNASRKPCDIRSEVTEKLLHYLIAEPYGYHQGALVKSSGRFTSRLRAIAIKDKANCREQLYLNAEKDRSGGRRQKELQSYNAAIVV